jgi:putative sigma-54 modulation protein
MQIHTTARHFELDPEDRRHAHERVEKFLKFARDIHGAHVVVTAEGFRHSAEITVKLKRRDMVSREESTEVRVAIDLAADRIEKQLRRLKEYRVSRSRGRITNGKAPDGTELPPGADEEFADFGEE